jgi:hypothetical protein
MRRRKLLGTLVLGLVALVAVVVWPRPDRITRENFERIKNGMSRVEVEAILGPPEDYSTGPELPVSSRHVTLNRSFEVIPGSQYFRWLNDTASVSVYFDQDAVYSARFRVPILLKQTPLDNLLWRAKRQWRKVVPGVSRAGWRNGTKMNVILYSCLSDLEIKTL